MSMEKKEFGDDPLKTAKEVGEKIGNNIEAERAMLSYDNLLFLSKESIGLRHVHGLEAAEKEKRGGVYGDAISTGSFANLIKPEEEKELIDSLQEALKNIPENFKEDITKRLISAGSINIPNELKDKIVCRFKKAIMNFIESSLNIDTYEQISSDIKLSSVVEKIINSETYFLIGKFQGSNQGYDDERYPLGKCGKQRVDAEDVYNYFAVDPSDFQSLELDKDSLADKDSVEKIYKYACQVLLEKFLYSINELQKTKKDI